MHSEITIGGARRITWDAGDRVGYVQWQTLYSLYYSSGPTLPTYTAFCSCDCLFTCSLFLPKSREMTQRVGAHVFHVKSLHLSPVLHDPVVSQKVAPELCPTKRNSMRVVATLFCLPSYSLDQIPSIYGENNKKTTVKNCRTSIYLK